MDGNRRLKRRLKRRLNERMNKACENNNESSTPEFSSIDTTIKPFTLEGKYLRKAKNVSLGSVGGFLFI